MKKFLVDMDDKKFCDMCYLGAYSFCMKKDVLGWECIGDLNNRPEWCPLYPIGESEEIWIDAIKDAKRIIEARKNEPR